MNLDNLVKYCENVFGLKLSVGQVEAFNTYQRELIAWNRKVNLTAITTQEGIESNHFIDSLSCAQVFNPNNALKVIDVGCGAGFPGIPLRIVFPRIELTLTDSVRKKTDFCAHILSVLEINDVAVLTTRAEELGQNSIHREQFDYALARAVAPLPILIEYLIPLVKVGGYAIAQKGRDALQEIQVATHALSELGVEISAVCKVEIPGTDVERNLVVMKKVKTTPAKYPRRAGIPAKRPLR